MLYSYSNQDLAELAQKLVGDFGPAEEVSESYTSRVEKLPTFQAMVSALKTQYARALAQGQLPTKLGDRDVVWSNVRDQLDFIYMISRWATAGYNVFNLTHGLTAGLILTDAARQPISSRLPFGTFLLSIPPGAFPFMHGSDSHGWTVRIWVHRFQVNGRTMLRIAPEDENGIRLWTQREIVVGEDELDYSIDDPRSVMGQGTMDFLPEDQVTLETAKHLVRNFVYWLNSQGGIEKYSPHNARRIERRKPGEVFPTHWSFGHGVKIAKELREAAMDQMLSGSKHARSGWQVRVKHVVRGHLKMQPHGPNRAERKQIWVEPYWRGPEGAEAWAHLYQTN